MFLLITAACPISIIFLYHGNSYYSLCLEVFSILHKNNVHGIDSLSFLALIIHYLLIVFLFCSVMKQHASLIWSQNEVTLKPATSGAKTKVNGLPLTGERVLKHLDRVLFGRCDR